MLSLPLLHLPTKTWERPNQQDINCLALNLYHEARGEPLEGVIAVGRVVVNRKNSDKWPKTICQVIYQKKQFSWTHQKVKKPKMKDLEKFLSIAEYVLMTDDSQGNLFYHSIKVKPIWRKQLYKTVRIGNHQFYTLHKGCKK